MSGIKGQKWNEDKKGKRTNNIKFSSILSEEKYNKIKELAEKENISFGKMVTKILENAE